MRKTENIVIRVNPEIKKKLQTAADAENRTLSGYLITAGLEKIKEENQMESRINFSALAKECAKEAGLGGDAWLKWMACGMEDSEILHYDNQGYDLYQLVEGNTHKGWRWVKR